MDHAEGAGSGRGDRVDSDPRVRLEFRGAQIKSDGGLLMMRERDNAPGLTCPSDNEPRLQLRLLACDLATFLSCIKLPEAMADCSLTGLQLRLIKIGARVERHARAITFRQAQVAVTGPILPAIVAAIRRLRATPPCAFRTSRRTA